MLMYSSAFELILSKRHLELRFSFGLVQTEPYSISLSLWMLRKRTLQLGK